LLEKDTTGNNGGMPVDEVEQLIAREDWAAAQRLLRSRLTREPGSHWLLARLSLTYYEQRQYQRALRYSARALEVAPRCPVVLWDHAGALQMLGRHAEAVSIYARLVRRDVDRLARGPCGEGRAKARGLIADCYFRASISLRALGRESASQRAFEEHLDMRGPGCRSIYPPDFLTDEREWPRQGRIHRPRASS
jgi:tetratricopeptide (TPR) repeat protein